MTVQLPLPRASSTSSDSPDDPVRVADTPPAHEISSSRLDVPVHTARAETALPPRAANDAEVEGGSIEACPGYARVAVLVGLPVLSDPAVLVGLPVLSDPAVLVGLPVLPDPAAFGGGADPAGRRSGSAAGDREPADSSRMPGVRAPEPAAVDCGATSPVARCALAESAGALAPATRAWAARALLGGRGSWAPTARSARVPGPVWALRPEGCGPPFERVAGAVPSTGRRSAAGLLCPASEESEVTSAMSARATARTAHARDPRRSSAIARRAARTRVSCTRPNRDAARRRLPSPCVRTRRARTTHAWTP